ncbi:acyl-CoA thioesterase [Glaciecola sp. XM2]|uniref:acyl-CoA thioesterase n=1 Tax=Glaciecola sp. XM2 TaxID=1914931 RepID=UPI001BDDF625|nr:thioesterase family protein [Glaciecola sp. XM2]MBT1450727.1 acyl-CoA thioesterase [Glaciecola sp. XM2]
MTYCEKNDLTLYLRARYGECDAQNVVFNARYADYADIAATEYLRALIGDYSNLQAANYENQVVSLNIDWKRSAVFDDVLALKVHTSHVGNTSFQFTVDCTKKDNGQWLQVAQMRITYVMVTTPNYEKCQIPALLKEAFAKPFSRVVDQAG